MDVLLRIWRAIPWRRLAQALLSRPTELVLAGALFGILSASGVLQYQAHWGTSGPMERGFAAVLALGLSGGYLVGRATRLSWPAWLMLFATLSLILPWQLDLAAQVVRFLPSDIAASDVSLELVGFAVAAGSLLLSIICGSALLCALCPKGSNEATNKDGIVTFGAGIVAGVMVNALVLGPLWGAEVAVVVAAALALGLSYRAWARQGDASVDSSAETALSSTPTVVMTPSASWTAPLLIGMALFGCGGAMAIGEYWAAQLTPQTAGVQQFGWSVIVAGLAVGCALGGRWNCDGRRSAWGMLLIAGGLALDSLSFETGVRFRLWSAAYLTNVTVHQLSQCGIVAAALGPMSFAAGLLIGRSRAGAFAAGLVCLAAGGACFREFVVADFSARLSVGLTCALCGLALWMFVSRRAWPEVRWRAGLAATAAGAGLLSPVWPWKPDLTLPAQLLFSTPTFLAYRSGWDVALLRQIDDSRLMAIAPGRSGPQTVWKSRGSDLLLRDAGVPRCTIACRPDLSPQMPSEVLQTVFPLLAARAPRRVLLLGSSGGVPLSTCLSFPVEQITCVESDRERVELIRGVIADERGFDPFADERVTTDARPVELAARMSDGGYDVIVSSPPSSVVMAAAPQFTREFYQGVSRKLSSDGVFCQRFDAVDYGPRPWQLVARSLLDAFRDVVAVEIGVGEYLFLATNAEHGLVPADLAQRLETAHVRRVLARCGLDWSTLLTLGAWDRAALVEIAADGTRQANTASNCRLAYLAPRDLLRWSPKLQEVQQLLTKPRADAVATDSKDAAAPSRRGRYLDWIGEEGNSKDLLRRLSEVAAQTRIILDGPDSFWLDYRKALRDELQQRPRTEIRQLSATDETERVLHPEDERRKEYFRALGEAGNLDRRSLEAVYALEAFFEPYDPLLSLFARQEVAELFAAHGHPDPATELALRLHVIHFTPRGDRSLRNVHAAAELLLRSPEAVSDAQGRFDTFNSLLQTLRSRWEVRSASQIKSVRLAIQDVDRSIVVIEKIVRAMDELAPSAGVAASDWQVRKEVIDRVLLRPLRGYRADLLAQNVANKAKTDAALREVKNNEK